MRFLGLGLEDRVPDAKTVWLYREVLAQAGLVEELFRHFEGYLLRQGYIARGGQILDASIVPVPKNRKTREENKTIKSGVSDAALHDSQAVDHLLMEGNTGAGVWTDSAYRSEEMEAKLRARGLKSRIHRKGKRGKPQSEQAKSSNRTKSSVRVRVEHVFGAQSNDMGGTLVRTISMLRAKAKIGMKNLAYNIRRLNPCPA